MKDLDDISWGEVAARIIASFISSLFGALYGSFLGIQQLGRFSGSFSDFLSEVVDVKNRNRTAQRRCFPLNMFWRKKPPSGDTVSEEYALGMRKMEAWYQNFVVWAYAYISLLEKRVEQLEQAEKEGGHPL